MKSQILLDSVNPILRGHQVFGRRLFPGLAYVDFLYQLFRSHGYDYRALQLRNLLIFSPLTVSEHADVLLTVEFEQTEAGRWQISVSGQERSQGMPSGPHRRYVSAEMLEIIPAKFDEVLDLDRIRRTPDTGHLSAVYAGARRVQLTHSGFMKSKGALHVLDGIVYADVELPAEALPSSSRFMFHPALLDGSVMGLKGAAGSLEKDPDSRLYLPLSYGSFHASSLFTQRSVARAYQSAFRRKNDVSFIDVDFFDEHGVKIAELRNIASKLVHAREDLQVESAQAGTAVETVSRNLDSDARPGSNDSRSGAQRFLREVMSARLGCAASSIDADVGYYELGLTSVQLLELVGDIEQKLGTALAPTLLFEYATVNDLSEHLTEHYPGAFAAARDDHAGNLVIDREVNEDQNPHVGLTNRPQIDVQNFLRKLIAQRLGESPESIGVSVGYYELGLTSVNLLELVGVMEQRLGVVLSPTLLFEYATIADLAEHMAEHYPASITLQEQQGHHQIDVEPAAERVQAASQAVRRAAAPLPTSVESADATRASPIAPPLDSAKNGRIENALNVGEGDIAIIGLSGRYPQAGTIEEFWENLKAGRDSVTEIPAERWDHRLYFDAEKGKFGKSYSKWGGFIDGVDQFDPLFFNIAPRDAQFMDPQERLFLQCVYEAMEDAGYTRESLSRSRGAGLDGDIGVFVGVMSQEYQLYGAQAQALGQPVSLSGNPSAIANRVSYFCNFHGPSMALDTMCSSSLTAIHLARQSLQRGECEMAIAGGVNLSIHPNKYLMLSQGQFASSKGRCESFGEGGDGYVPGEGVGAVLLKSLSRALADGDQIYGVIKASSINHGGKTHGYTVPNPAAQAQVIAQALKESGIPPRAISYIEAHGTGTSLGDPIEIAGLSKAFAQYTPDTQFCAIGSAKSNIGHLESAAGIAGVTKILLQMKHGQLVPSLHSQVLNPHIDFASTPFIVQRELSEWHRPQVPIDGRTREYPRIAGISSFGAGGSNAHLVIEEYRQAEQAVSIPITVQRPAIIVLSAKSEEQLQAQAQQLLQVLQRYTEADLASIAYTLQVGREAMEQRLAFTVTSLGELSDKLTRYLAKEEGIEELYRGEVKRNKDALAIFAADEDMSRLIDVWIGKRKYTKLLDLWVKGLSFDWRRLHGDITPRRISLPTYPFAKERYWIDQNALMSVSSAQRAVLHPLLHENTSTLLEQSFSARFNGEELFFAEHRVLGEKVLPGVAYLEMAYEAMQRSEGSRSTNRRAVRLKNVIWSQPAILRDSALELHIRLHPRERASEIEYEIYSSASGEPRHVTHSQGAGEFLGNEQRPQMKLLELQAACAGAVVEARHLYEVHGALGIQYGPSHQAVQNIRVGEDESGKFALVRLMLPESQMGVRERYVLHPSLLDSALHAWLGFSLSAGLGEEQAGSARPMLPFALDSVEVFAQIPAQCWACLREAAGNKPGLNKMDADLCDDTGAVCVRVRGITARALEGQWTPLAQSTQVDVAQLMRFEERWEVQAPESAAADTRVRNVVFVVRGAGALARKVLGQPPLQRAIFVTIDEGGEPGDYQLAAPTSQAYREVFERIEQEHGRWDALVYLSLLKPLDTANYREVFALLQALTRAQWGCSRIILGGTYASALERCYYDSWIGFARSLRHVLPQSKVAMIAGRVEAQSQSSASQVERWLSQLCSELQSENLQSVLYEHGERYACQVHRSPPQTPGPVLRRGATYLICGGAGGLGLLLAAHLCETYGANLILSGRSALDAERERQVQQIEQLGGAVLYVQADITQRASMQRLLEQAHARFGPIHGVIHAAGAISLDSIAVREIEDSLSALATKVTGTLLLDELLRDEPLEFLCYFSSSSAVLGDFGSCDYAVGNRFQSAYASAVNIGPPRRRVALQWPLWKDGGMNAAADSANIQLYLEASGQRLIEAAAGLALFENLLGGEATQPLIMAGSADRIEHLLGMRPVAREPARIDNHAGTASDLEPRVVSYLKKALSSVLRLAADRLDAEAPLSEYGIDSVMVLQLTRALEKDFGSLSKTLFFEYQTITDLARHFLTAHRGKLVELLGIKEGPAAPPSASIAPPAFSRFARPAETSAEEMDDIAIIGLSGRYPQARTIEEFWENLKAGRDSVTEIPAERWDHRLYFDAQKGKFGKSYSKWGGFVDGVDQFDPLFFNLSPRDAVFMDPQERLFLQCVYEAMEDSGYTRESLSRYCSAGLDGNVGVFVGVMYDEYQLYAAQAQALNYPLVTSGDTASIANRLSYFCNFHGPSLALNTLCSSSLTAIHLARQSLQRGECEVAIAGGVNLSLHPNKYLKLSQGQFISSKGRCESFGEGGDGYVPGEGVGAVLLKSLSRALADGDQIYGVIKASSINHGGKTHGYTVPNPTAQAQVIAHALKESGVPPRAISYIEAHGTGTSLGDPIEIAGLSKAFAQYTPDTQFCAIGSAKSNIGHLESAAGIAGVTKILLQMKHGQLVPSLHSQVLNPHIDFASTPFIVQRELSEWHRPQVQIDGRTREYPRIAGISSFGAGGSNAHLVIEEYRQAEQAVAIPINVQRPALIVLSAKSEEQLQAQAQQLLQVLQRYTEADLASIAYTLQVGREAMEQRLAFTVTSLAELSDKLSRYLAKEEGIEELYRDDVKRNKDALAILAADEDMSRLTDAWVGKRKYSKLLDLWVKGLSFDWRRLYGEGTPRRISLPTYPFARERYWIDTSSIARSARMEHASLHPLLHRNTSTLTEQRFASRFSGEEFFLSDHRVLGEKMLPGVAYLEMARAAVEQASEGLGVGSAIQLRHVVWMRPFKVNEQARELHIALQSQDNGQIEYQIYTLGEEQDERIVHSQGAALWMELQEEAGLDVAKLRAGCTQWLSAEQCYAAYESMGLRYGAGHRSVQQIGMGEDEQGRYVLARLVCPSAVRESREAYVLHPGVMDGALQAALGMLWGAGEQQPEGVMKPALPFALEELKVLGACAEVGYAYLREAGESSAALSKLDIRICDEAGRVQVVMSGLSSRVLEMSAQNPIDTVLLEPQEVARPLGLAEAGSEYAQRWVVCGDIYKEWPASGAAPGWSLLVLQSASGSIAQRYQEYALQLLECLQQIVRSDPAGAVLIQLLVPSDTEESLCVGLGGMLRSAQQENPQLIGQVVQLAAGTPLDQAQAVLEQEAGRAGTDRQVRYGGAQRYVQQLREVSVAACAQAEFKADGVYLLTGGAGGLGLIFAREIAQRAAGVHLVLTGRSQLSGAQGEAIEALRALGAQVEYEAVDVSDREAVEQLLQRIQARHGRLSGIVHSAGVIRDSFLIKKTAQQLQEVFAAKVQGLVNLDEASQKFALELFVVFSSGAAVFGQVGQADYAAANAFMDAYVQRRHGQVKAGLRQGRTVSINWPLWAKGGMQVDAQSVERMRQRFGVVPLSDEQGIRAFYDCVTSTRPLVIVQSGRVHDLDVPIIQESQELRPMSTTWLEDRLLMDLLDGVMNDEISELQFEQLLSA